MLRIFSDSGEMNSNGASIPQSLPIFILRCLDISSKVLDGL
jgi:hypothetical protein